MNAKQITFSPLLSPAKTKVSKAIFSPFLVDFLFTFPNDRAFKWCDAHCHLRLVNKMSWVHWRRLIEYLNIILNAWKYFCQISNSEISLLILIDDWNNSWRSFNWENKAFCLPTSKEIESICCCFSLLRFF